MTAAAVWPLAGAPLPWLVGQASQASGSGPGSLELKWRRPRSSEGTRVPSAVGQSGGSSMRGRVGSCRKTWGLGQDEVREGAGAETGKTWGQGG